VLSKVSVVVGAANGLRGSALYQYSTMTRKSTMDRMSAEEKKKIQGFPHVFYIRKF
jgi:CheY-specific phosphatase CheX